MSYCMKRLGLERGADLPRRPLHGAEVMVNLLVVDASVVACVLALRARRPTPAIHTHMLSYYMQATLCRYVLGGNESTPREIEILVLLTKLLVLWLLNKQALKVQI